MAGLGFVISVISAPANIVIDFAATQAVSGYSQTQMDAIAGSSFYFEHASVGGNMLDGLNALRTSDATFYRLSVTGDDGSPPATVASGVVYEYNRGNPPWEAKVTGFATDINSGWGGKVTFALNKFCYIDQMADFATYRDSMLALESAPSNAGTNFVYMTIPLTNATDADNVLRNQFNASLRSWASANNKIVFDVADIEAHDLNGVLQTYQWGGQTYQRMADDRTSDGGHLNAAGSVQVAKGFYALSASVTAIPEPSTYAAFGGIVALLAATWRRRRRSNSD